MFLRFSRLSSCRRDVANPEIARTAVTSGAAKGAARDEETEGHANIMVLELFRRVRRGRNIWVVRIGERRRALTVSAQLDGGMVATGPEA